MAVQNDESMKTSLISPAGLFARTLTGLALLLVGAFAGVLGASTGRWVMILPALPVLALALTVIGRVVVLRNRGHSD